MVLTAPDLHSRFTDTSDTAFHVQVVHRQAPVSYTHLRGYGATQGIFAVESAIDELAEKIGMNPIAFRELNVSREGDAFVGRCV